MAILEEGRGEGELMEARKLILRFGKKSLGAPNEAVTAALGTITDLQQLERLIEPLLERVVKVKSWQELLATP